MTKENMKCNHCDEITYWYPSMIHEVGLMKIDNKLYCLHCAKKIGIEVLKDG